MTGNDIVDLSNVRTVQGPRVSRYLDKIFSPCEQDLFYSGRVGVWAIWAMKEAVYKAHHRRFNLPRSFDPVKIRVYIKETLENSIIAGAEYMGFEYWGQGSLTTDYVHFTATCIPQEKLFLDICNISTGDVRTQLKMAISNQLHLELEDLSIVKDENHIPQMRYQNCDLNLPFSISHHGKFAAFSFQLMNY